MEEKIFDQVADALGVKHYSHRTEQTYVDWIRRYILFQHKRYPREMGETEIQAFVTYLATERNLTACSQNQTLSAIIFLFRNIPGRELALPPEIIRAKKAVYLPTVLAKQEALAKVVEIPQVIGLKDASFDAQRFALTRDLVRQADHPVTLLSGNDNFILESFLLGAEGGLLGYGAVGVGLLVDLLEALTGKDFPKAAAMQSRVQGFCDYIYARPLGDYRARCKVALVHMGLLAAQQTFVRPPFLSLWEAEKDAARQAVQKAGLLEISKR